MTLKSFIRSIVLPFRPINYIRDTDCTTSDCGLQAVTQALCLGYPPIRRAVMLIANDVAKLPLNAIKYNADGTKARDYDQSGYRLLNENISPFQTPFIVKRELIIDGIFGNAYGYILRDEYAEPYQLLLLDPSETSIKVNGDEVFYHTVINNTKYSIPSTDIFHLRSIGRGLLADSLCDIARNALGLSLSLQSYAAKYFKNGTAGTTIVDLPPSLTDEGKRKQFINDWRTAYEGNQNAHRTIFAPPQTKVTQNLSDNEKSQLIESREFDLIQVANVFGVEPFMLGAQVHTSYSSLVEASQSYLDHCLDSWLVPFEQEANLKLRTYSQQRLGRVYFEFERKALISMDAVGETDLVVKQVANRLISVEYGREILNLPPEDKSETYLMPSTLSEVGLEPVAPPQALPVPPEAIPMATDTNVVEKPSDSTQRALTAALVARLCSRLEKSNKPLDEHRAIWNEDLGAYANCDEVFSRICERYSEEFREALPEQRTINKTEVTQWLMK